MGCRPSQYLVPQRWCKGVKDKKGWYCGPISCRPKTHIRQERGDKVQEVGVKRDSTRANEEFSGCDLPNVRKKMSAPVDDARIVKRYQGGVTRIQSFQSTVGRRARIQRAAKNPSVLS